VNKAGKQTIQQMQQKQKQKQNNTINDATTMQQH
jgi:hypothetical protein